MDSETYQSNEKENRGFRIDHQDGSIPEEMAIILRQSELLRDQVASQKEKIQDLLAEKSLLVEKVAELQENLDLKDLKIRDLKRDARKHRKTNRALKEYILEHLGESVEVRLDENNNEDLDRPGAIIEGLKEVDSVEKPSWYRRSRLGALQQSSNKDSQVNQSKVPPLNISKKMKHTETGGSIQKKEENNKGSHTPSEPGFIQGIQKSVSLVLDSKSERESSDKRKSLFTAFANRAASMNLDIEGSGESVVSSMINNLQRQASLKHQSSVSQLSLLMECCTPRFNNNSAKKKSVDRKTFDFPIHEETEEDEDKIASSRSKNPLVQEFLIIGASGNSLYKTLSEKVACFDRIKTTPELLYHYSYEDKEKKQIEPSALPIEDVSFESQLANFLFPFGYFFSSVGQEEADSQDPSSSTLGGEVASPTRTSPEKKRRGSARSLGLAYPAGALPDSPLSALLQEHIYRDSAQRNSQDYQCICLNSEETLEQEKKKDDLLELCNPHRYNRYYCIVNQELVCLVDLTYCRARNRYS